MKKLIMFVLALACLAGAFLLAKELVTSNLQVFKNALTEAEQWKTLM